MASYRARAVAIYELLSGLRCHMECQINGRLSDKMALIDFGVEVTNKLLYCFMLSQQMFDNIDDQLNRHLSIRATPQAVTELYLRVLEVVRSLEACASEWVEKYR